MDRKYKWELWRSLRQTEYYKQIAKGLEEAISSESKRLLNTSSWDDTLKTQGKIRGLEMAKAIIEPTEPFEQ